MTRAAPLLASLLLAGCAGWAPAPADRPAGERREPVGQARVRYRYLPHQGPTAEKGRGLLDLERGYYEGDLVLEGQGMEKKGAGIGETVVDGHVRIHGSGWTLTGMTIRGEVEVRGDDNDVTGCKVQGGVRVVSGERNRWDPSP